MGLKTTHMYPRMSRRFQKSATILSCNGVAVMWCSDDAYNCSTHFLRTVLQEQQLLPKPNSSDTFLLLYPKKMSTSECFFLEWGIEKWSSGHSCQLTLMSQSKQHLPPLQLRLDIVLTLSCLSRV